MIISKSRLLLVLKIVGIIVLLPLGIWLTMPNIKSNYSAYGYFYGSVHAQIDYLESPYFGVVLKGKTKPQWRWGRPSNFAYTSLEFEWSREPRCEGTVILNLSASDIVEPAQELTEDTLKDYLLGPDCSKPTPEQDKANKYVYSLIMAAQDGTLPKPRHHPYSQYDEPIKLYMTHFFLGRYYPYSITIWVLIWLVSVFILLLRARILFFHGKRLRNQVG